MRTTLTLDEDVAVLLTRLLRERKITLKKLVNAALRQGLQALGAPPKKGKRFRIHPLSLGKCARPNLDNVEEVLSLVEGENRR